MNRFLTYFNLLGIICLLVLLIMQWQANRQMHLDLVASQKENISLQQQVKENVKSIIAYKTDLDFFRTNISQLSASEKKASDENAVLQQKVEGLTRASAAASENLEQWKKAVQTRDERLVEANKSIESLGEERNALAKKYNELATKYNALVSSNNAALSTNQAVGAK